MSRRDDPKWLSEVHVRLLHAESLQLFGGAGGLRDATVLSSAMARPQNRLAYDADVTVFQLASEYAYDLARNHAFADGNKRVALLAIRAILFQNGFSFVPDQVETVTVIEGLASGKLEIEILAQWIESSSVSR